MRPSIIILGAGGHAKVLVDALLKSGSTITGIVDPNPGLCGSEILGIPVLGGDNIVTNFPTSNILLANGLGSTGFTLKRQQLYEKFKDAGYLFATVVHPSAVIASDVTLGEGVQIMAGAVVQTGSRIGINSIINTRSSVDHDCIVGDHVHIAPGVTISGGVNIGSYSHVGTGATVIQGITIGEQSLLAAGTVVIRNVHTGARMAGVPARELT